MERTDRHTLNNVARSPARPPPRLGQLSSVEPLGLRPGGAIKLIYKAPKETVPGYWRKQVFGKQFSHVTWWLLWNDEHWLANQPAGCANSPVLFEKRGGHWTPTPLFFLVSRTTDASTTLAKKIETGTQAKHRAMIGACMLERSRACATCARLSQYFLARVVHARSTFPQSFQGSLGIIWPLGTSRLGVGHSPEMTGGTYKYEKIITKNWQREQTTERNLPVPYLHDKARCNNGWYAQLHQGSCHNQ